MLKMIFRTWNSRSNTEISETEFEMCHHVIYEIIITDVKFEGAHVKMSGKF